MIEKLLPGTKVKMKIVKAIYENPSINVTNLIKKVNTSPNSALDYINLLEKYGILKATRSNGKKVPVRNLVFDFNSPIALQIISIIEIDRRYLLLQKYAKLNHLFDKIYDNVNGFALLYGSYTRFAADKESDIDLLIVDNKANKSKINEVIVTFPEVSLKIDSTNRFLSALSKPLYQNILKEHVIICNELNYLKTIKNHMR